MPERPPLASRIRGAIYGLATCDALGGPVEFKARGSFPQVTSMLPNDNFDLPAGCFTDDTSMALCLAQSLVEKKGQFDPIDQVKKYLAWWQQGYMSSTGYCFDIGISTTKTLAIWDGELREARYDELDPQTGHAERDAVSDKIQAKITHEFSRESCCGNGSLMRVLPTALVGRSEAEAVHLAATSSSTTHPHLRCVTACSLYAALVYQALNGMSKRDLATSVSKCVEGRPNNAPDTRLDPVLGERLQVYRVLEDWKARRVEEIQSSGYVLDSLEAALWAFFTTETFEDGAIRVVNLGDDADTVGAIYGGLAGAYYGIEAMPHDWLKELKRKDLLDEVLDKIVIYRGE